MKISIYKYLQIILFIFISLICKSQTVYKTPSGAKYHLASCRMVNNVSKELSIPDAIKIGIQPCKICKPSTVNMQFESPKKITNGTSNTVQCKGITKAGTRCKHMTSIANGYCFQHNPEKK